MGFILFVTLRMKEWFSLMSSLFHGDVAALHGESLQKTKLEESVDK